MGVYRTFGTKWAVASWPRVLHCTGIALYKIPTGKGDLLIVTTLKVPKTGGLPTTKVNVVRWLKQEGEAVKRGEAVVELETEKVNYELDSPVEGILLKILTKEGAEVPVGDAVCQIGQVGDAIPQD
ncbi:MAG TPA: biotin/lipoyl-containing protein [Verrucomicrobiae bacterium]|nr:biotin/lipoyl-containing protein [Verrucomicrobiae bacterium]